MRFGGLSKRAAHRAPKKKLVEEFSYLIILILTFMGVEESFLPQVGHRPS